MPKYRAQKGLFLFSGCPGSSHDAFIFQRSSLYYALKNNCDAYFDSSKYPLVGDSAFPLKKWLITLYKIPRVGQLSNQKKLFNRKLSTTRVGIEQSFGDVKNRFRRCRDLDQGIERAVNICVTSCVFHNVCIQKGDLQFDGARLDANCHVNNFHYQVPVQGAGGIIDEGILKRDAMCAAMQPILHNFHHWRRQYLDNCVSIFHFSTIYFRAANWFK